MMSVEAMKNVNVNTVDRNTLVQRGSIRLDESLPSHERLQDFVRQMKNPYCYMDGKIAVKISFINTATTIEDCLENYLRGL